jgi:hypothetical protein
MRDREYPPLIANGFKDIIEEDLHKEFVSPFNAQALDHRCNLLIGFGNFLNEFKTLNIAAEVWIDGSFATKAPDPGDVDVVFYFKYEEIAALSDEKLLKFQRLFSSRKFMLSLYQVEVHYAEMDNDLEYKEWKKVFGTCYDNTTPKGIFRLLYNN